MDRDIGLIPIHNDFLDFDDDDFTEDALRRITQMIDARNETRERESTVIVEQAILKECKLFMSVVSLEGIPPVADCLGLFKPSFWCEIEIMKIKGSFHMTPKYPSLQTTTSVEPVYVYGGDHSKPSVWDLAEYFGETMIRIKIFKRKLVNSKLIGTRDVRLSELLQRQNEQKFLGQSANISESWSVSHSVLVTTTLPAQRKRRSIAEATSSSWLETAKNASTTLTSTTGNGLVEHRKPAPMTGRPNNRSHHSGQRQSHSVYAPVPTTSSNAEHERKGSVVTVNLSFRIVQLQQCLVTNVAAKCEQLGPHVSADNTICQLTGATHISELHLLAATAPATVVVDVMRGLSRKNALPQALALLTSSPALAVGTASRQAPLTAQRRNGGAGLGARRPSASTAPQADAPASGWSAFDIALLNRQDATVLEMLQRCGSLCFSNIATGRSSPLHMAVLGGSVQCVELVGRYIRKFGTRKVSGPGARLWNSSLSAKLEWRDGNDDTALALACRLPPSAASHSIVVYLLILGADCAALNAKNKCTPLMYACRSGCTRAVSTLLSITKSNQDVMDAILNVGDVNSILNNTASLDVEPAVREQIQSAIATSATAARSSALAQHLQSNARSRNILRGQNVSEGGHFNPLSVYMCEPCRRDSTLGRQAAHIAADNGHTEIVASLLEIGMSCADTDLYGDNLMHMAARRGNGALITKLIESETKEWEAFQGLQKKGKTLETLHHRAKSILLKNCAGDSPLDLAMENRHFTAFEELLTAAARLYGVMDPAVLEKFAVQLEQVVLPPSPTSRSSKSNSSASSEVRLSSAERHLQKCKKAVAVLLEAVGAASKLMETSAAAPVGDQEQDLHPHLLVDNEADSIEYLFALSSLGMKFITDNASSSTSPGANPSIAVGAMSSEGKNSVESGGSVLEALPEEKSADV